MPQMLMITQKYILRLYFLESFNGIFCLKLSTLKKYKIGLSHLASTNLFSFTQNEKIFNGFKVNN